jgi:ribosomal protein S5
MTLRAVSAILFSPRGGSAHVARALARCLRQLHFSITLVSGSRSGEAGLGDAEAFYGPEVQAAGERARAAAVDRFSWSGIAAQLATVLAEVAGTADGDDVTLRTTVRSRGDR